MFKEFLEFPLPGQWWYVLMLVWVVFWKGMALWKASRLGQKWWFVALLVVNTFGILEIFYIYVFSKRRAAQHHARRAEDIVHDDHSHAHTTASILADVEPVEDEVAADQAQPAEKKESTPSDTPSST